MQSLATESCLLFYVLQSTVSVSGGHSVVQLPTSTASMAVFWDELKTSAISVQYHATGADYIHFMSMLSTQRALPIF